MTKVNTVYLFIPVQSFCNNLETFICSIWIHFIQTPSVCQWVKYAVPGNIIMKLHYWVHIQSYRFTISLAICSESWYASCLTRITSLYSTNKELQIRRQQLLCIYRLCKAHLVIKLNLGLHKLSSLSSLIETNSAASWEDSWCGAELPSLG